MKLKTLLTTTAGVFAMANAYAGDKEIVEDAIAVEPDLGAEMAIGYNTHYIFRGTDLGENQITAQLDYAIPGTPLALGAWYGNPTSGTTGNVVHARNPIHSDELDLYATLSHSFGAVDAWLRYTAYTYPEGGAPNTNEIGTGVGTTMGPIDFALGGYYDLDIEGWFFDLSAGHSFTICDSASLDLSAGISYQVDYNSAGSDWNNVLLMASVPIKLSSRATLTPYIAETFAMAAIEDTDNDELFGGVSLSVAF